MSAALPRPKDLCDLIVSILPDTLTTDEKTILTATCRNLENEGITPNELYNLVLAALPSVQAFLNELQVETYLKDTFKGYSEIWVPVQFLLFIGMIFVIVLVLMVTGTIPAPYGIVIIVLSALMFTIVGIAEFDSLVNYLNSRETQFKDLLTTTFDKYKDQMLLGASSGVIAGSSMNIYSPAGPFNPPSFGPYPVTLTNPSNYNLEVPYTRLIILQTTDDLVYNVFLSEPSVAGKQMIKPSYGKVIYIVNYGPGTVFITNASETFTFDNNASYPVTNTGTGATIATGQCRAFINLNYSMFIQSIAANGSVSTSNWVVVK